MITEAGANDVKNEVTEVFDRHFIIYVVLIVVGACLILVAVLLLGLILYKKYKVNVMSFINPWPVNQLQYKQQML